MAFKRVFEPVSIFTGFDNDGDPVHEVHFNYHAKESIGDILAAKRKVAQDRLNEEIMSTFSPDDYDDGSGPVVNTVETKKKVAAKNLPWSATDHDEVNLIKPETPAQKNAFKKYGRSGWVQSQKRIINGETEVRIYPKVSPMVKIIVRHDQIRLV